MHKLAVNRNSPLKDTVVAKSLTVIHQLKYSIQKPDGKYKTWVMPPLRERYVKHKNHDPL